jgi:hypothetical protein
MSLNIGPIAIVDTDVPFEFRISNRLHYFARFGGLLVGSLHDAQVCWHARHVGRG